MFQDENILQPAKLRQNKKETSFPIRIQLKNQYTSTNLYAKKADKLHSYHSLNTSHKKHKSVSFNTTLRTNVPTTQEKSKDLNESKVSTLQDLIKEIKSDGFDKIQNEIVEKEKIKKNIEKRIKNLEKNNLCLKDKYRKYSENTKNLSVEKRKNKAISDIYQITNSNYMQEISTLNSDIEDIMIEYFKIKAHNSILNHEISQEQISIDQIKKDIKVSEGSIFKEQEYHKNILGQIVIIKKQNASFKEKITLEDKSCKEFMNKITLFVENSVRNKTFE